MDKQEFIAKVAVIAKHKYDIESDVLENFKPELEFCWKNSFGPIRTVEFIAGMLF